MPESEIKRTSLFLAVGQNGLRIVSKDGRVWENAQTGKEGEIYRAAAVGNGRYVAVGSFGGDNILASSVDGVSWTLGKKEGKYRDYIRALGFGNGQFLGLGGDPGSVGVASAFVAVSDDGIKWGDFKPISGKFILRRIAFGAGPDGKPLFVGVGDRGRRSASPDGLVWTDVEKTKPIDTLVDIAYGTPGGGTPGGKGVYVGVGLNGLRMTTADGQNWSEPVRGDEGEHLNAVVWANDRFVAVGMGATWFSPDGVKWDRSENHDAPLTLTYGLGVFVGTNWRGRILVSKDAISWTLAHKSEHHLEAVTFGP